MITLMMLGEGQDPGGGANKVVARKKCWPLAPVWLRATPDCKPKHLFCAGGVWVSRPLFGDHLIVLRTIISSGHVPIISWNLCMIIIDKGFLDDDKITKDDNIMKTMTKAPIGIVELTCAHLGFPCSPSERQQLPLRPRSQNTKPTALFHSKIQSWTN